MERALRQVAEAVNNAETGNVINGSEIQVRDVMRRFSNTAFEKAVQMRIDSTESSFFPLRRTQRESGQRVRDRVFAARTRSTAGLTCVVPAGLRRTSVHSLRWIVWWMRRNRPSAWVCVNYAADWARIAGAWSGPART